MTDYNGPTYQYTGVERTKTCDCGVEIFFAENQKTGKWMPVVKSTGLPHWIDCPEAASFRRKLADKKRREHGGRRGSRY